MERFINILLFDPDGTSEHVLPKILNGNGNNVITCKTENEAILIGSKRKIAILIVDIEKNKDGLKILTRFKASKTFKNSYAIVICDSTSGAETMIKGLKGGAVDYFVRPFDEVLVKAKVDIFKNIFFKDYRINQLLQNIFPKNVLRDFNKTGKFSPKRHENGTVIFTDFVEFSKIAKNEKPLQLIKKLETYFNKFDEIILRYKLEKIKTIGDAYMAVAGITEKEANSEVRTALAALEMRDFIVSQSKDETIADNWDVRIGIHTGPLVAGIIGAQKISFDIWGDTVNIAARTEEHAAPNSISITNVVAKKIAPYFNLTHRGEVTIKHNQHVDIYVLNHLKREYSMFYQEKHPSRQLRTACGLIPMDFELARKSILNKLRTALPSTVVYHDLNHTLHVEKAAKRLAFLEGVQGEDLILLRTAVLFHDVGFIVTNHNNENIAVKLMKTELPQYGYSEEHIEVISKIIRATIKGSKPESLLEKIMCDADHDYFGKVNYHIIAKRLRLELENQGKLMSDEEWIKYQLNYLQNVHIYHTETAQNIRGEGKKQRVAELLLMLEKIQKQH